MIKKIKKKRVVRFVPVVLFDLDGSCYYDIPSVLYEDKSQAQVMLDKRVRYHSRYATIVRSSIIRKVIEL